MKSKIHFFIFIIVFYSCSSSHNHIVEIKKKDFKFQNEKFIDLDTIPIFKKSENKLKLSFKNINLVYKDDLSEENYLEYNYIGKLKKSEFYLISQTDNHKTTYFLIHSITCKKYDLVGFPVVYKDKIFAIEDRYTDSQNVIQCFEFKKGKLELLDEFSLINLDKRINNNMYYFKNNYLYFEDNFEVNPKYFKIKISSLSNYKYKR